MERGRAVRWGEARSEAMNPITNRARELRRKQTPAEEMLWQNIRNGKLGRKIVRQKPIVFDYFGRKRLFVADFYCKEKRLVIEVDGSVHARQKDYDSLRTALMRQMDLKVVRFTNKEILEGIDGVLKELKDMLASPPSPLHKWRGVAESRGEA